MRHDTLDLGVGIFEQRQKLFASLSAGNIAE